MTQLKQGLIGLADALRQRLVPRPSGRYREDPFLWNLRLANRLLWLVLLGLAAYVGSEFVEVQTDKPADPPALEARVEAAAVIPAEPVQAESPVKPLSDYLTAVMEKNPFQTSLESEAEPEAAEAPRTAGNRIQDLTRGLMVVGIDRGANPVAFVEDIDQKRTYLVGIGDTVNGMVVKEIGSEGVILSYEGEEILLP